MFGEDRIGQHVGVSLLRRGRLEGTGALRGLTGCACAAAVGAVRGQRPGAPTSSYEEKSSHHRQPWQLRRPVVSVSASSSRTSSDRSARVSVAIARSAEPGRTPNPSAAASSHATSSATVRTSAHASSAVGIELFDARRRQRPADAVAVVSAGGTRSAGHAVVRQRAQTPDDEQEREQRAGHRPLHRRAVGPAEPPAGPSASRLRDGLVHARREMLPEERRRLGHSTVGGRARAPRAAPLAVARHASQASRCAARAGASVPSSESTSSASLRCVIAATSSDWPARGRGSPSPRRPSCRGCRQSPRAAAHDKPAESTSRAASAAVA